MSASLKVNNQVESRSGNRLLAALPQQELARLLPHLTPVHLKKKTLLYQTGEKVEYCYFLKSGMLSVLSTTEDGKTVEVSMIGSEGMAGIPAVLQMSVSPYEVMVQIEADALKIKAEILKAEFNRGTLHLLLLRYIHALLCQIT